MSRVEQAIYLLPDSFFEINRVERANAPAALEGVPIYHYSTYLKMLPLAIRLGEIQGIPVLPLAVKSNGGVVFRFNSSGVDIAMKFPRGSGDLEDSAGKLLTEAIDVKNSYGGFSTKVECRHILSINDERTNRERASQTNMIASAAANIAHALEPEYFPKPHGLWFGGGRFITMSMPFLEGRFGNSQQVLPYGYRSPEREKFRDALKRVSDYGVSIDDNQEFAANFVAVHRNGEVVVQGVDLYLSDLGLLDKPLPNK